MESFYGGKQGTSFVIKSVFFWIRTSDAEAYYDRNYSVNTENKDEIIKNIKTLVQKEESLSLSPSERVHSLISPLKGNEIESLEDWIKDMKSKHLIMEDAFADPDFQEVWFGEYALIDTPNKNDTHNGKVYKRTLKRGSLSSDKSSTYEYVGQIVGPSSGTPIIQLQSLDDNNNLARNSNSLPQGNPNSHLSYLNEKGVFTQNTLLGPAEKIQEQQAKVENSMLVPGKKVSEDGAIQFNDDIVYTTVNMRLADETVDESVCYLGLQIPYLVQDWIAKRVNYNELPTVSVSEASKSHPFYDELTLSIPAGLPGVSVQAIEEIAVPDKKERIFYKISALKPKIVDDIKDGSYVLDSEDNKYPYPPEEANIVQKSFLAVQLAYPVANGETYKLESNWFGIGSFNQVKEITIVSNALEETQQGESVLLTPHKSFGQITVGYQGDKETETFGLQLPNNFTLVGDATSENADDSRQITIGFSNEGQSIQIGNDINYIQGVKYTDDYHLLILFNSPNYRKPKNEDDVIIDFAGNKISGGSDAIAWRKDSNGLLWKDLGVIRQVDQGLACGAEVKKKKGASEIAPFISREEALAGLNVQKFGPDKEDILTVPGVSELNQQKIVVCSIQPESGTNTEEVSEERHLFAYGVPADGKGENRWFWVGSFTDDVNNNSGVVFATKDDNGAPNKAGIMLKPGLAWFEFNEVDSIGNYEGEDPMQPPTFLPWTPSNEELPNVY